MQIDEQELEGLLEQSRDIHSDAMRDTKTALDEVVTRGLDDRSSDESEQNTQQPDLTGQHEAIRRSLVGVGAAAGVGAAMLALSQTAASASTVTDIQILQTNQSIENLAIATYSLALTLPFIGGSSANGVVKAFAKETLAQHKQHEAAFASAIIRLHGRAQRRPDPVLLKVVDAAKPSLTSPAAVVALALELEDGAAQTYVATTGSLSSSFSRSVTASIMGVEAQHVAVLRAVQALLAAGDESLIALPPTPLTALPSAAGSVGFPLAFYPTSGARPRTEGAVR